MKTGLFAASAVALVQLAAAQPHGHRHIHAREPAAVTTTILMPQVIVYVDETGNTLSAETLGTPVTTSAAPAPPAPEPTTTPPSVAPVQAFVVSSEAPAPAPAAPTLAAPVVEPSAAPSPPESSGNSGNSGNVGLASVKGTTYSPFHEDGNCKNTGDVATDIQSLASQGFNAVRIYGVECNQVANVVPAAKKAGMTVIAGLFNPDAVSADLDSMKQQLGGDFSSLSAVTVFNEPINNGRLDASAVAAAIGQVKGYLKSTNFGGKVAAVDTFNQLVKPENAAVIAASDFVAANCHPWFDTDTAPSGAGKFVQNRCFNDLGAVAGGKEVVITESGWPCAAPNARINVNLASTAAQGTAMGQIKSMPGVFAFSPFSTAWHKDPNSVENNWGWNTC